MAAGWWEGAAVVAVEAGERAAAAAAAAFDAAAASPYAQGHVASLGVGLALGAGILAFLALYPGEPTEDWEAPPGEFDDLLNDLKTKREPGATAKAKQLAALKQAKKEKKGKLEKHRESGQTGQTGQQGEDGEGGEDGGEAAAASGGPAGSGIRRRRKKGKKGKKGADHVAGDGAEKASDGEGKDEGEDGEGASGAELDSDEEGISATVMRSLERMPDEMKSLYGVPEVKNKEELRKMVDEARRKVQRGEGSTSGSSSVGSWIKSLDLLVYAALLGLVAYILYRDYGFDVTFWLHKLFPREMEVFQPRARVQSAVM